MRIAPAIEQHYLGLNEAQRAIIGHLDGPLLVIAGPGSGKTYSIVLRALNLLLLEKAQPRQILLCTFTEKAAFEMRDRLAAAARKVGYTRDLSELTVSTIHGFCNRILTQYRHRTELGHGFETLDDLTQLLFIFEHFDEIIGPLQNDLFLGKWKTRWTAIEGARGYFDKITEELVDPTQLASSDDSFLAAIGNAYRRYERALFSANRTDFAHLQRLVYDLIGDPEIVDAVTRDLRYVLVDEYQDTNYIQEQLLLRLTEKSRNLCVVGDEDQSLYRFRGATVRNILEFPQKMPGCTVVRLTTNYRSHRAIVERYDRWMASADWSNPQGPSFRYDKTIEADAAATHPAYPSVIAIWGKDKRDEAARFADFVDFLKRHEVIADYSQVALLLHSVREEHSGPYLDALATRGIPAFCPRARAYFEIPEVRDMVACFAVLFGWHGNGRGQVAGAVAELAAYVDDAIVRLARRFGAQHPLAEALQRWTGEIAGLRAGETLDLRPADYFYRLLALEPFRSAVKNENTARNLAIFSQLLNVFQNYYHYTVVTHKNREFLRLHFFNSFLRLLYDGGINEYEDPDQPFPRGHVQVMTIHQSKGLEFPVVVVGSLTTQISSSKQIDRDLAPYYHRPPFEPENRNREGILSGNGNQRGASGAPTAVYGGHRGEDARDLRACPRGAGALWAVRPSGSRSRVDWGRLVLAMHHRAGAAGVRCAACASGDAAAARGRPAQRAAEARVRNGGRTRALRCAALPRTRRHDGAQPTMETDRSNRSTLVEPQSLTPSFQETHHGKGTHDSSGE
jgi:DNA helicase-2/ATP-dependent DNA helicase PcrA